MMALGFLLLAVNVGMTCLNIYTEQWYLLSLNALGVYFSIKIIGNS